MFQHTIQTLPSFLIKLISHCRHQNQVLQFTGPIFNMEYLDVLLMTGAVHFANVCSVPSFLLFYNLDFL